MMPQVIRHNRHRALYLVNLQKALESIPSRALYTLVVNLTTFYKYHEDQAKQRYGYDDELIDDYFSIGMFDMEAQRSWIMRFVPEEGFDDWLTSQIAMRWLKVYDENLGGHLELMYDVFEFLETEYSMSPGFDPGSDRAAKLYSDALECNGIGRDGDDGTRDDRTVGQIAAYMMVLLRD